MIEISDDDGDGSASESSDSDSAAPNETVPEKPEESEEAELGV